MHGEGAAGLGHGAQVDGVAHQLGLGALGLDDLLTVAGRGHAHDAAAALIEVAEDIAHVLIGHGDLQLADGLEQNGGRLGHRGLVGKVRGGLERDFRGVDRVIGAIVEHALEVDDRIAGERAVDHGFAQALFHGGEEVLGHAAAEHFLGEDHLLALLVGLEADPDIAELAAAAGLLLMTALLLHGLADLFTVGNARGVELGVHAEAGLELAHEHVDLNVARAGDDHLMGLGVVDDGKGRVLFIEAVEAGAELFLLTAGLGRDGAGVAGLGVGHTGELDDALRVAEGVAGLDAVHLGDGADVAAADLLDLLVLLALEGVETAELFGVAGGGVVEGHIAGDLAADDLDQRELAVLVRNGLEDDGGGGAVFIVGDLNGVAVVVLRGLGGHIGGDGNEIEHGLHQHIDAETGDGAAAEHGSDAAVAHAELEALGDLLGGELHGLEEFFHKLLIGAGGGFHQLGTQGLDLVGDVGGNGALGSLAALDLIGLVVQQVDDAGDLLAAVDDGGDDGRDGGAELALEGVETGVVVAVLLVGAVDEDHAGLIAEHLPGALRADAQAVLRAADQHGALGRADTGENFAGEVKVARSVEHVDLHVLVLHGGDGEGDGDVSLDLFRVVVAGGVAVGDLAEAVGAASHEQHTLSEGGLAASAMAEQHDIANVFCTHRGSCLLPDRNSLAGSHFNSSII